MDITKGVRKSKYSSIDMYHKIIQLLILQNQNIYKKMKDE